MNELNYELFISARNNIFDVCFDPEQPALPLTLVKISDKKIVNHDHESFSLLFHGPKLPGCLAQGSWTMENKKIGNLSLFIVPVGENEKHYKYEAIINHKITCN